MMYDGAAVTMAETVIPNALPASAQADASTAGHGTTIASAESKDAVSHETVPVTAPTLAADAPRREIAFVSTSVADWRQLADSFAPNVQVVILDGTRDGVEQISQALAGRQGIDAIHILSHGVAGQIELGTAALNETSMLGQYRDALLRIGASLTDSGDILVYGCNFSAGEVGNSAAHTLSMLTGADVAASNDLTGAARFGGNWNLETQMGSIETQVGVSLSERERYDKLMAPPVAVPDTAATVQDTPVTISVLNNDTDPDHDPLSITSASALHGTVVINAGQTLTYTPNAGYLGLDKITYAISDGNGGVASSVVDVSVVTLDVPPTNTAPLSVTVQEDLPLVFSAANGNALSISDPDSNTQTVTLSVTKGTFTLSGTAGLTFSIGDGTADQTMAFSGTTAAINAALENSFFQGTADANGAAQLNFQTITSPTLSPTWINGGFETPTVAFQGYFNENVVPGWETDASDNLIEFWHTGFNGVPAYEGNQLAEINATQNAALFQNFTPTQGSLVGITFSHRGRDGTDVMRVVATDLGADGLIGTADDTVLLSEQFSDNNTQWGTYNRVLTNQATGHIIRFEFRAVSTASGDPTSGNLVDGIQPLEGKGAATITQINIVPVADIVNDQVRTSEDTPLTFNVITGTNEVSGADNFENAGRALTGINGVAFVPGTPITISGGTILVQSNGTVTFTPDANYHGTSSFNYTVTSGGATETATVTLLVDPVSDAPSGTDKTVSLDEGGRHTFAAADFGFSDSSDSPANAFSALVITTLPAAGDGVLSLNGVAVTAGQVIAVSDLGQLTFTPLTNRNGTAIGSFTFQVRDDGGTANGGMDTDPTPNTFAFNITSVNDAPSGTDKTVSLDEDGQYTFAAADFGFSDSSDSPANAFSALVITSLPAAGDGVLSLNGVAVTAGQVIAVTDLGQLTFTPLTNRNGSGIGSFTFQVRDDGGTANGGVDTDPTPNTFAFNITSVNDAPSGTDKTV
ncbi:DUF4347 domain-containing protein, partial [Pseudomonas sp. ITA]|uniref:DUF4347 domain-containing protein n=1 Tax=Pseudomonas sp. ITA TaxID=2825841 RepID=UPI002497BAD5